MSLQSLTRPELVFPELTGTDSLSVLRGVAERMAVEGAVRDADDLFRKLVERERLGSTGVGSQVAIPHCKLKNLDRELMSVGICRRGVDFSAPDGKPVKLFFTLVSPESRPAEHLHALAAISKWVKADKHVQRLLKKRRAEDVWELLGEEGG